MSDLFGSPSPILLRVSFVMGASLWAAAAAAQNPVSLVSVSGYGNFHAGGVVATVSGDANFNATAALEWRPAGGGFQAAHPLARIDATHFVGSLFELSPGTSYEARVTLSDPDGVTGSPQVASFATRADTLPQPTLRTLYVSPSGNDGNPGTSALPLRTIQRAATLSQAGDLILIQPGVYRESVNVPASGTASQPIVFRGNGPGAIVDGADAAIAAGVPWSAVGGGAYSRVLGFPTGHVVADVGRLYQYGSLAQLQGLGAGAPGGFFFDGTTLYVKFSNGTSPATHTMHVARHEEGIVIDSRAFVRVENLEIRHYGSGPYGKGVYLRYSSDCTVRACRIHDVETAGVWAKGGNRHRIEDNEIWDTSIFNWPWDWTKGSSAENNGVSFTDEIGRGNVVRRNTIHGTFNGIGPCGSTAPAGFTNETDLYDNVLYQHTDDAYEPEGYCANVRIWNNQISYVHMAVAVAPAAPGPVWILRNVAWRFGATRTSQTDGYLASALKINSGDSTVIGPLFVYHNTFLTDAPATDALALLNNSNTTYIRARNNVVAGTRYALYKVNPVLWDGNGNDFYTTAPPLVRWHDGTTYANLSAYRAGQGQELLGLSAPPQLISPTGGIFEPAPGSPLIDAGLALPGINDGFSGSAPDVGAIESTGPPPELSFYTVPPCRVADTRNAAGPSGGPALGANTTRTFPVTGRCTIPPAAKAVAINVTVVGPTDSGNLRLYPAGAFAPGASTINFMVGKTRANNAVIPIGAGGQINVRCDMAPSSPGQTHFLFDVTGYFQ